MKKAVFLIGLIIMAILGWAQPPANYYQSTEGLTGNALKSALHNIIKGHTSISYSQIWNAFWSTDNKGDGVVWDMYSDVPGGTPPYTYQMVTDQCGSYSHEGDCYNREHSWPQSWFNNDGTARTDMHHIFATDGYVNNKRDNYAFGEVRSASWTSQNGSKLGSCMTAGFSGTVFEPIDEYKGDFARAIMYMSVRYYGEDSSWKTSDMTEKSEIKPWAIAMLLRWNKQDPVSQKEIDRNNAIYDDYQHNRNPFVDDPDFADRIWDPNWHVAETPSESSIEKADRLLVYDFTGRLLMQIDIKSENDDLSNLKNNLQHGCYLLQYLNGNRVTGSRKLLVN